MRKRSHARASANSLDSDHVTGTPPGPAVPYRNYARAYVAIHANCVAIGAKGWFLGAGTTP